MRDQNPKLLSYAIVERDGNYIVSFKDTRLDTRYTLLNQEPFHCMLIAWLESNTKKSYFGREIGGAHVVFDNADEAMLCYLAFS